MKTQDLGEYGKRLKVISVYFLLAYDYLIVRPDILSRTYLNFCTGSRATIIDGKSVADDIKQEVTKEVKLMKSQVGKAPGLAVIVAGSQRSSMLYVQNKTIACDEVGISSVCEKLPEDVSEEQILATIRKYNEDPSTHGILVQLPLPKVNAHTDNTNSVNFMQQNMIILLYLFFIGSLLFLVISNT